MNDSDLQKLNDIKQRMSYGVILKEDKEWLFGMVENSIKLIEQNKSIGYLDGWRDCTINKSKGYLDGWRDCTINNSMG